MVEKLHPQIPHDSHLPQEVVVGDGWWRLSTMGLLEVISREGKPRFYADDGTSEGHWIGFPADYMIENLFFAAKGPSFEAVSES